MVSSHSCDLASSSRRDTNGKHFTHDYRVSSAKQTQRLYSILTVSFLFLHNTRTLRLPTWKGRNIQKLTFLFWPVFLVWGFANPIITKAKCSTQKSFGRWMWNGKCLSSELTWVVGVYDGVRYGNGFIPNLLSKSADWCPKYARRMPTD